MMNLFSTVLAQAQQVAIPKLVAQDFDVPGVITFAITTIFVIAGIIFFFMLVIGGLRWVLSGGDKAQTEAARSQITAALIGIVIIFSAWAIAGLLKTVFGVDVLQGTLPKLGTGGVGG